MAGHIMATNWVTKAKVTWAKQLVSWLLPNVFDTMAGHIMVTKWVIEAKVTRVKRLFCRDAASHYPLQGDHARSALAFNNEELRLMKFAPAPDIDTRK